MYVGRDKVKGVPHHAKAGNINSCLLKEGACKVGRTAVGQQLHPRRRQGKGLSCLSGVCGSHQVGARRAGADQCGTCCTDAAC